MTHPTRISKYLTYEEAIRSDAAIRLGIDNTPTAEQVLNMQHVATFIFDAAREKYCQGPLYASSFFRSRQVNAAVPGSSPTSAHMTGEAIDMDCDIFQKGTNAGLFHYVMMNLETDQTILEYPDKEGNAKWVHVGLRRLGHNRNEHLVKLKSKYVRWVDYEIGMI